MTGSRFAPGSAFSAADAALLLEREDPGRAGRWLAKELAAAARRSLDPRAEPLARLALSRVAHSLGSAVGRLAAGDPARLRLVLRGAAEGASAGERAALARIGLPSPLFRTPRRFAAAARAAAFANLGRTIVAQASGETRLPRPSVRADEIVWGRAPARLDLGGGWTDTPPYALERGGSVINAAVDLNGQPPIQAFARVLPERVLRLSSIDHGERATVRTLDELLDFREPSSRFALAKAALALSGFSLGAAPWPRTVRTLPAMLDRFGGGIELTTLAAIPSGSGLGTSSIMGAVLVAVLHRLMGRALTSRELFYKVLQLEQALTTGGGWQDQIGGVLPGVKLIAAAAGIVPDPLIQPVAARVLDPRLNGGRTLLYYTGMRRLARNILQTVVGRYLDRDTAALETLRKLHAFPPRMAAAMDRGDAEAFGRLLATAWELKKSIDPDSTTGEIEAILGRIGPRIHGATLLGAGAGGFLLIAARSAEDAAAVRAGLERRPPNGLARFFDYEISERGLTVTSC